MYFADPLSQALHLINGTTIEEKIQKSEVIQKMMAKEPVDRYPQCSVLLEDLELVLEGKSPSSLAIEVLAGRVKKAFTSAITAYN